MGNKLLVRAYNVELGDCIYCRIPDASRNDDFHMLIDCGSLGSGELLREAIEHLAEELPRAAGGKRRLDLLVVTHQHKDHMAGFDPEVFEKLKIGNIWMSTAMDKDHPQAVRTFALHAFAAGEMRKLAAQNLSLSPELSELVNMYGLANDEVMEALRKTIPEANDVSVKYVHADMGDDELDLGLTDTKIHVLGPEENIDFFYLGDEDATLRGMQEGQAFFRGQSDQSAKPAPANISLAEFRSLQSRMLSNAFAFTNKVGSVTNNTSAVLLIEWKGKRLLFVGDAEWEKKFADGRHNGSWNVMWHKRKALLNAPVDFLKIGHHGSVNATPWNDAEDGETTEPSTILDAILPLGRAAGRKAKAIVSTKRGNIYPSIPSSALLVEIGRRISNTKRYKAALDAAGVRPRDIPHHGEREKDWLGEPQPIRTDFEFLLNESRFVEVEIDE